MSGYTKGTWRWREGEGSVMASLHSDFGFVMDFGDSETYYPVEGNPPNEADARLIAAAPDLLEALKMATQTITEMQYDHNTCQGDHALTIAATALSKAEARS